MTTTTTTKKKKTVKRARKPKATAAAPAPKKVYAGKIMVLRTCTPEMTGTYDVSKHFKWPESGPVEAPDWDPKPECGHGLHGLAWGDGDWGLLREELDSKWLAVEVDAADLVKIDTGKVKFRRGNVVYCGNKAEAIARVLAGREAMERAQAEAKEIASGDGSTAASSGYGSTAASSGNYSTAASSGDGSTAASSGDGSKAASSGDGSKAASSGYGSTAASSGNYSTAASSGDAGIAATIGTNGLAAAGKAGLLIVTWWDDAAKRYRACVGEVGADGIEPDTWYGVKGGKLEARGKVK